MRVFLILVLCLGTLAPLAAQNKTKDRTKTKKPAQKRSKRTQSVSVTPERQAHVMAFVKQHHPELSEILVTLKAEDPRAYQRAVRDLHRTSERLISIRERFPQRYDLELKIWKTKSRSALLATRFKMSKDESIRKELRTVVDSQIDLQLELLKRDVAKQQERLDKLTTQMRDLKKARKQIVERQMRVLTQQRKSRNDSKSKKPRRKPKQADTPKKSGQ